MTTMPTMPALPVRPAVLLVDSPLSPAAGTLGGLRRAGVDVILLRFDFDAACLDAEHARQTARFPVFVLDGSEPLMNEAARYLRWVKGTKGLPRPRSLHAPDAELHETVRAFAQLVDLPVLATAARELVEA